MVLAETTGTDTVTYLHGLGLVAQSDGVSTEHFVNDGLGSVRQLVDPVGEVLLAQTYDPYGSLYASAGMDSTAFGYAGEQEDANGLVFLRARYYSPSMGRFLNMDPSRMEENAYRYSGSNPIMFVDPSGEICLVKSAPNGFHLNPFKGCGYLTLAEQQDYYRRAYEYTYRLDYEFWRSAPLQYHANVINNNLNRSMTQANIYSERVLNLPLFNFEESRTYFEQAIPLALNSRFAKYCSEREINALLMYAAIDVGFLFAGVCTSSAVLDTFYVELMEASPCSLL